MHVCNGPRGRDCRYDEPAFDWFCSDSYCTEEGVSSEDYEAESLMDLKDGQELIGRSTFIDRDLGSDL
jgi:hypothetical protein